MSKKNLFFALLFFLTAVGNVFSQEEGVLAEDNVQQNLLISTFNIEGLKRTKRHYMDKLLSGFLQKPASDETLKAIETKLQAENLFDQIKVSAKKLDGERAEVDISFKEKWSVLPFPIGYYTGDSFAAGLFLMDMNTFGLHCSTILGGLYSTNGIMGAGVFQKPPVRKGEIGFVFAGNISKNKREFANSRNYKVFEYESFYAGGRGKILLKPSDLTQASFGVGYSFFNPIDSPQVQRRNQWSVDASWGISTTSWNGFFLNVNSFNVGGELLFSDVSEQVFAQTVSVSGEVQRALFDRLRLVTGARGFFSNNLLKTNYVGRGNSAVTLLPTYFMTDQICGLFTGFEAAVVKAKFGVLSIYGLYEVAVARELNNSIYACSGPEMGLRVYLAKLAFPAFAMGASYNINENRFQYSFSGGASF
ncbi:MAG: hypothetical protein IKN82_03315 [Treponema sp.]|nr:hypothetical protein [Treponema sp.]